MWGLVWSRACWVLTQQPAQAHASVCPVYQEVVPIRATCHGTWPQGRSAASSAHCSPKRSETTFVHEQVLTQLAEHIAHSRPGSAAEEARLAPMPAYGRSMGAPIPDSGLWEVLGDPFTQLALSISALLPWMALHFRHSPDTPLAAACTAVSCLQSLLNPPPPPPSPPFLVQTPNASQSMSLSGELGESLHSAGPQSFIPHALDGPALCPIPDTPPGSYMHFCESCSSFPSPGPMVAI